MRHITFCNPKKTLPLSITGAHCDLKCAHCGGHFLFGMRTLKDALSRGSESYLVSGGCDSSGGVPITENILKKLKKKGAKLNVHSGFVTEEQAEMIGKYAEVVSFDFVGDDETITAVYNSGRIVADYVASYQVLRKHTSVVPHICIGLKAGRLSGEFRALDILAKLGADEITFIVFMPVQGTKYQACNPPTEADARRVFDYARELFPRARLNLGCMRPRRLYDIAAVEAGLDSIVLPSRKAVELCLQKGYKIEKKNECCSF